mmetsp:Transcript_8616/g.9762  ORF Transcript_8616/g.9762 Transcript_8616/m.9762 type:complete len:334 (-) Transcript_8616:114-1115(-)
MRAQASNALHAVFCVVLLLPSSVKTVHLEVAHGRTSRIREKRDVPLVDQAFSGALPIEFIHLPKAGSSFLNTLTHVPGACPGMPTVLNGLEDERIPKCNQWVWDTKLLEDSYHASVGMLPGGFEAGKGRFMMFMRQPEQRVLSEVHYRAVINETVTTPATTLNGMVTMADKILHAGWAVKMLVRGEGTAVTLTKQDSDFIREHITPNAVWDLDMQQFGRWLFPLPVARTEIEEAKVRLQTGFSFVGITDQWDLTICLFNAMFNQTCRAVQFHNNRPTFGKAKATYDIAELNGWRDPADNELFDVAMEIFEANLKKYNVSVSSCQRCRREAGMQ